jgi:hypothetical protein
MTRTLARLFVTATIVIAGWHPAGAQEANKGEKPQIPGGIEAHVKRVDVEKETLTIVTPSGAERTLNVTEETTMLGPRGGKVRRGLSDPRFHEGMRLTVVASGTTVKEIHLGYDRRATDSTKESGPTSTARAPGATRAPSGVTSTARTPGASQVPSGTTSSRAPLAKAKTVMKKDEVVAKKTAPEVADDEDNEFPGTVKSYNAERRLLVVTLLNGTNRSFFLSKDLKVLVRGTASKQGVADPAIKEGAHIVVLVEQGDRRVKELHVAPPPPARRTRKAA